MRVGSTLSELCDQEQGVPQGAILSTTLFNVKLNDIINCLDYKTDGSLYVDDFCICFRSKNMRTIERHLQQCLNRIEDWETRNGFKFSKSKTQCVLFCQQRKIHHDPALYIYGSEIPVVAESKFLGVIFDRKLSKVLCILHHWGVQLILAYSWARPAILVVGKGRGGMFLFLLFLHFHSCSSFFPVPLFHLLYSLFYLFSPFLWETTQNDPQGLTCR